MTRWVMGRFTGRLGRTACSLAGCAVLLIGISASGAAGATLPTGAVHASEPEPPPNVTAVFPGSQPAKGGKKTQIKGTNFTGATEVLFGTVPATSFTIPKPTEIIAVTPASIGVRTVDVTVRTPAGTSEVHPADQLEYVSKPPAVSGVTPNQRPAAGGTIVWIGGENFLGAKSVMFGAYPAVEFKVLSAKSIRTVIPAESVGIVDVHVSTEYGESSTEFCKKGVCVVRDHLKFIEPTVTEVSPNHGPAAGGTTVTVTGTGFVLGTEVTGFNFLGAAAPSVACTLITSCTVVTPAHGTGSFPVLVTGLGSGNERASAPKFTFE